MRVREEFDGKRGRVGGRKMARNESFRWKPGKAKRAVGRDAVIFER
jgi:hypothetical protein